MSFTTTIKEEICRIDNISKSESIAELSGFLRNNGTCDEDYVELVTENATVAKRIYTLMKNIYDVTCNIETRKGVNFSKNNLYLITLNEKVNHILKDSEKEDYSNKWLKLAKENKELRYMLNGEVISCDINNFDNENKTNINWLVLI